VAAVAVAEAAVAVAEGGVVVVATDREIGVLVVTVKSVCVSACVTRARAMGGIRKSFSRARARGARQAFRFSRSRRDACYM